MKITVVILILSQCLAACSGKPGGLLIPFVPGLGREPSTIEIMVDDFIPQPYRGDNVYYYNRLEGDRGAVNDSLLDWGEGQVTTRIGQDKSWGGGWMSLNHPIQEGLGVDFSALLPVQIVADYQSQITGIQVVISGGTPGRALRLELKEGAELRWKKEISLKGGEQILTYKLPTLGNITQLVWVLDRAREGDFVILRSISFQARTAIEDTATAAFVWSYGMLLNNWNPATGLGRDKAKDASGEMDAIQATGALAAATAQAEQLGVIERQDALGIVATIGETLLNRLPRYRGLWPHWVKVSAGGEISLLEGTEWSSVDTVIAALGLLEAQSGLGMDTSGTQQMLQAIDWSSLVTQAGISHGYTSTGELIPYAWDTFGGESWLVALAYAAATGQAAPMVYPTLPTANGSGFIDELAWLFVPPPEGQDGWGTEWAAYRTEAASKQISYYAHNAPAACLSQLGLFGLSAGEVPDPTLVAKESIYQAFGVGGRFALANNGAETAGGQVALPHYSATIASLRPQEAIRMWDWLIEKGHFSPLTNVESFMFPNNSSCEPDAMVWNQLKGSWNLALQTLGWGRYLAEKQGKTPVLWQAVSANTLLQKGYLLLTQGVPAPSLSSSSTTWEYQRECEYPDEATTGGMIWRSEASGVKVHGPLNGGYVKYKDIHLSSIDHLYLKVHYSKYSPPSVPILIYLDDEPNQRASFIPENQGNWDRFAWSEPILLGSIGSGVHSIKFSAGTQEYGVADLDMFVLSAGPVPTELPPAPTQAAIVVIPASPPVLSIEITQGPELKLSRSWHTATRLLNGKVLLVGGSQSPDEHLREVELFDPATGQTSLVAPLHTPRHDHTATLLSDGRVLVVGGYSLPQQWVDDAEVYDPSADTWTVVPPLYPHGVEHTATLMQDGRVLVVGGCIGSGVCTNRVEIFNSQTNTWTEARPLESTRASHTAILLEDGRVLVAGGGGPNDGPPAGGDAMLYDPQTNTWSATGPMVKPRLFGQSVRLADGRVLVAGGLPLEDQSVLKMSTSVEIYDPATNAWTTAADLSQARFGHVLVLLSDGQVLAAGGAHDHDDRWTESSFVREIEIYDPITDHWRIGGELAQPRVRATATLLSDGRVWVTGGQTDRTFWSDTWLIALSNPISTLSSSSRPWIYQRECEFPNDATVGQALGRSNASGLTVHGQFGATADAPWPVKSGYVRYMNITISQDVTLSLKLRYSKYNSPSVPILIWIDDEPTPRATFYPEDQGDWNRFAWTEPILLGSVEGGVHSLIFSSDGQPYGVAELDKFVLSAVPRPEAPVPTPETPAGIPAPAPTEAPYTGSERIFFTVGDTLYQMNLDGSGLTSLVQGLGIVEFLTVDVAHNKLFLTNQDRRKIYVLDLPGAKNLREFSDIPGSNGQGLAIDPSGRTMFLGLYYDGVYVRDMNAEGNWQQLISSDLPQVRVALQSIERI